MDYYGLLFLYYLKGLSGKSILRLFFNIEVGGTEQLLPENTSTPTTTPILADIQYPDGLRTDQYFTYRETPTTVSNKARIKTIKGNTLVWNQLVQNGNFADTSKWSTESGATLSISNNIATISSTNANNGIIQYFLNPLTVNHKYLIKAEFNVPTEYRCVIGTAGNQGVQTDKLISTTNTWTEVIGIGTCTIATTTFYCFVKGTTYENVKVRNVMCFDLTQMGLDISNPSDFTSFFSLPYYAYNQGTLLSFNGNGVKTVGFNQWDEEWEVGGLNASTGALWNTTDRIRSKNFIDIEPSASYYIHYPTSGFSVNYCFYDGDKNFISSGTNVNTIITTPTNARYMKFATYTQYGTTYNHDICINISDPERNGEYEPYTSSTLSLPISTYFPSGMKSAGNVYDELTETKSVTRIGAVDLGSLTWTYDSSVPRFYTFDIQNTVHKPESASIKGNVVCPAYITETIAKLYLASFDHVIALSNTGSLNIKDTNYNSAETLKSSLQGVYLYYELAEYQETPITTEDANEALSLLMGRSVSSNNAKQMIDIITKGE